MRRRSPRSPLYAVVPTNALSQLGNVVAVVALPWFANSNSTTSEHTGYVAGAPLAGVLITTLGAPQADAYDAFEATIHEELIPPELRARAFALLLATEMMVVPLAMLLYGFLLDAGSLRAGLLLFAVGNALLGACAISSRPAHRLTAAATAA